MVGSSSTCNTSSSLLVRATASRTRWDSPLDSVGLGLLSWMYPRPTLFSASRRLVNSSCSRRDWSALSLNTSRASSTHSSWISLNPYPAHVTLAASGGRPVPPHSLHPSPLQLGHCWWKWVGLRSLNQVPHRQQTVEVEYDVFRPPDSAMIVVAPSAPALSTSSLMIFWSVPGSSLDRISSMLWVLPASSPFPSYLPPSTMMFLAPNSSVSIPSSVLWLPMASMRSGTDILSASPMLSTISSTVWTLSSSPHSLHILTPNLAKRSLRNGWRPEAVASVLFGFLLRRF